MSNNTTVVKIDKERHSKIKLYAAFKGLSIVDIINSAVDYYLNESEDFLKFREKYLLPEKERNLTVSGKDYEKLIEVARKNNIKIE